MNSKIGYVSQLKKTSQQIEHRAEAVLNRHVHFHGRASRFEFECRDGDLIVRGSVPSFYMRETLQTALQDVEGVRWLDNQVAVVSPAGLSDTNAPTMHGASVNKPTTLRMNQASTVTNSASRGGAPYRTLAC